MVLSLEAYNEEKRKWIGFGRVNPGDKGSMSDNKADKREVYVFGCLPDDSKSIIYRSKGGIDIETESSRLVSTLGLEVVKELKIGESYEMRIKSDISPKVRLIRFSHR